MLGKPVVVRGGMKVDENGLDAGGSGTGGGGAGERVVLGFVWSCCYFYC